MLILGLVPTRLFAVTTPATGSAIIRVPTDYKTISEAVAQAVAGDTIFVASGRYNERVRITQPIRLLGEKASAVIIGGTASGAGLSIRVPNVVVERITSTNVISISATGFTIRECIIRRKFGFSEADGVIDRCILLVVQETDYGYPSGTSSGGAALSLTSNCTASNNLILGVHYGHAGHFTGEQPPFITPTPGIPGPHSPVPGYAEDNAGIWALARSVKVVNNTVVNVSGGDTGYLKYDELIHWTTLIPGNADALAISAYEGVYVANNIIWNTRGGVPHYPNYDGVWESSGYSIAIFESNLIFDADYPIGIFPSCSTVRPIIRENYWASPEFVDPTSGDYHLRPNSPAIDSGTPIPWLKYDLENNNRPTNYGWDIGAFEYQNLLSDFNKDGDINAKDLEEFIRQWHLELPKVKKAGNTEHPRLRLIQPVSLSGPGPMPTPMLPKVSIGVRRTPANAR